jgi:hypothetical protein
MAESNPQPKFNKFDNIDSQEKYEKIAINKKTLLPIDLFIMNEDETDYLPCSGYDPNITTYYSLTAHEEGYTNLKLPDNV